MKKIVLLHGPNHAMFGKRDPKQCGSITLAQIDEALMALGMEGRRADQRRPGP